MHLPLPRVLGLKACATTASWSSNLSVTYDMYTENRSRKPKLFARPHMKSMTMEWTKLLPPTPVLLHQTMMLWKSKGVRSCYSIKLEAEDLPASCSRMVPPNCTIRTASIGSKEPWCQSVHYSALHGIKTLQNRVNWPRNSTPRHVSYNTENVYVKMRTQFTAVLFQIANTWDSPKQLVKE